MKCKKCGVFWAIVTVVVIAAAVALALIYKQEILNFAVSAKEKVDKKRYAHICRDEYRDYADVD